jgi:hypothetical protein
MLPRLASVTTSRVFTLGRTPGAKRLTRLQNYLTRGACDQSRSPALARAQRAAAPVACRENAYSTAQFSSLRPLTLEKWRLLFVTSVAPTERA